MSKAVKLIEYSTGGNLTEGNFAVVTEEVPALETLKKDQLLVRITDLSADPHMRQYVSKGSYYSFPLDQTISGIGVGIVEASTSDDFKPGDAVSNPTMAWANYSVVDAATSVKLDTANFPLNAHLGVLGMTSFTAYLGLALAKPKQGETIVVSAAGGAVGQIVIQLAKELGLHIVAISSSDEKNKYAESLGANASINYKTTNDMAAALHTVAPHGIDIYWDNVGGELLDLILTKFKKFGRAIVCGAISQYSADRSEVYRLKNVQSIITSSASLIGFLFSDYMDTHYYTEFIAKFTTLVNEGKIKYKLDVVDGIEKAPTAFIDLFGGANFGKRIIHVADP
ncbi:putative oxidoreductase [Umbelopsis sp. AD052]|nr:putative oxidoreductase [Umbelopsis sp. AD052]